MTSTEVATDALSVLAPRLVQILAKAEWLNPGGSIKDRAAWGLITAAENSGALKPGGTVVEGVSSSQTVRLVGDAVPAPGRWSLIAGSHSNEYQLRMRRRRLTHTYPPLLRLVTSRCSCRHGRKHGHRPRTPVQRAWVQVGDLHAQHAER